MRAETCSIALQDLKGRRVFIAWSLVFRGRLATTGNLSTKPVAVKAGEEFAPISGQTARYARSD